LIHTAQLTDHENCEVRFYGRGGNDDAGEYLLSSFIITNGSKNISTYSDGRFFITSGLKEMPVSRKVTNELKNFRSGDTTGCGDNFVGGVIASDVTQLQKGDRHPDLLESCCWGVVAGGFTCFYLGGTYFEERTGE